MIVPPIGLIVPFLPPFYSTIWVGGVPYYYANEVYYAHRGNGYIVVEPPKEEVSEAPPAAEQMFIYPREGQSEQQQADDPDDCTHDRHDSRTMNKKKATAVALHYCL